MAALVSPMQEANQTSVMGRLPSALQPARHCWAFLLAALLWLGVTTGASAQTAPVKVNFESRKITISGQANNTTWQSVTFTRNFNGLTPIVIMGPAYSADGEPHVVRVRSVTATGFQWQIDEWDYLAGVHAGTITVDFFAITEGTHVFGSQRWVVGKNTNVNRTDTAISLTGFTAPPHVVAQVYTTNNNIATNNPRSLKSRISGVTATGFNVNLETQQSYTTAISAESVGYVAVSEGIGYLDGKVLWAYSPGTVGHTIKTFYMGPFTNPVTIAQTQTKNDTEPGELRLSTVPSLVNGATRVQLRFQEEISANADLTHAAETVSGIFIGDMPGETQAKLIYANASITQAGAGNWTKVNLGTAYTAAAVVFGPLSRADGTAAHIRVRNVLNVDAANSNRASFEYQVDEWDFQDGIHGAETVSYMVMEQGVYAIGGQIVQAGAVTGVTNTGTTQYVNDSYWAADIYFEREPAIFAQCVTAAEASAAIARVDTVDTLLDYPMNFRLRLTEAENADQTHAGETVHYIVMPGGGGQFMSANTNFRFHAGVSNTLSTSNSVLTFPNRHAQPSFFAAPQGELGATLANDGYHETLQPADLDPVSTRQSGLNAVGVTWALEEDASPGAANNTHAAEVGAWLVFQGVADTDGDGVSDAIETQMGTSITSATSATNASGGTAPDWETLLSLQSLTASVTSAVGYERVDKTIASPVTSNASILLSRSNGTMALTLRALPSNGSADPTKSNAAAGDYAISGVSGGNITFPAGASTHTVNITPVQDATLEVPEFLKVTFGPVPSGANPQIVSVEGTVRVCESNPALTQNRRLYVAYLARGSGVISNGSGIAVAQLEGDNDNAKVSVTVSGLSSAQNTTYLRMNNDQDIRNNLGVGQLMDVQWNVRAAATATTDQAMLNSLEAGQIYCDINTVNYTSGEILGYFNFTTGSTTFDPGRADLVEPALPGSLTAAEAERDIHRFLDQCTFGATTDLYNAVKAKIDAIDAISDGVTPANMKTGYTNWLNDQMNTTLNPNPSFLTLVMAADNEEFVMRNTKPLYSGNDQQFAGNGFTATYDTYGNVTNPYTTTSSNISSFNSPNGAGNGGANRRREWWTMALQAKAQVRQRMAAALSEIVIISENDSTVASRHYGAANYWDMLANGAFGKYRDLLEGVTYSPMMGIYLSHLRNRAQYTSGGVDIFPDENYAREIMQLFTIGLVMRHPDGGLVLGANGLPIATYDQGDITELARVLTGLCHGARHATVPVTRLSTQGYNNVPTTAQVGPQIEFQGVHFTDFSSGAGEGYFQAPWLYPMKALGRYNGAFLHDFGAKRILHTYLDPDGTGPAEGGTVIPAQDITALIDLKTHALADTDIRLAHNALAGDPTAGSYNGHQNTPVFITRQLIQRLVTSNPSAGYVYRASNAYRNSNGNLGETLKAILLDYEARSLNVADTIVSAGKLKEPLIQFASFLRALKPSTGAPLATLSTMSIPFSGSDSPMLTPYPASEVAKFSGTPTRIRFNDQTGFIGQSPQKAPSVFNWFLPDYVQPGLMATNGLYGPELQINTESMLVNRVNRHWAIALMGLTGGFPGFGLDDFSTNSSSMAPQIMTAGPNVANPGTGVTTLIFDATNWNQPQTVTIHGLENLMDDGTRTTSILHQISTVDPSYVNTYSAPLDFTVNDNDTTSAKLVAITQTAGSTAVTEGGTTDTYKIVLTSAPAAGTTVTVTPSAVLPWLTDTLTASSDVTFSPTSVVFNDTNWGTAQTVTVTANNDTVVNSFVVAAAPLNVRTVVIRHGITSTDAGYNGSQTNEFNCAITDNDTPTRRFVPSKGTTTTNSTAGIALVTEGLTTASNPDTYTVAFASGTAPTQNVTLNFAFDNTRLALSCTDGTFTTTGGTASLTFTPANYTTARTINITPVDDAIRQGIVFRQITHTTTSTDATYSGLPCAPLNVRINDNDSAATNGVTIVQTWGSTTAVEGGMTDIYLVALNKAPTANVALNWTGNDGDVSGIGNLTFTTSNWYQPQTITVTGRNDFRVETTKASPIRYSASGGGYNIASGGTTDIFTIVSPVIGDDDLNSAASITMTQSGGTTAVTEGGATDTLDYKLNGAPNNDVVITLTANSQLTLSSTALTFTPQNWGTTQTVTVTAANDTAAEPAVTSVIVSTVGSTDVRYNNSTIPDVSVAVTDNDTGPRIVLAHTSGTTEATEGGATDILNVSLSGPVAPTQNVTVNLPNTAQTSFSSNTLTFTSANWTTVQPITVTAINDATAEVVFTDTLNATSTSTDTAFTALAANVTATIFDNDEVNNNGAISFVVTNGATRVVEGGTTDTYDVVLRRAPTANVTLTPTQVTNGHLNLSPATLTYTPSNWNIPQTVSVSAIDDTTLENAQNVVVTYTASATGGYIALDTAALTVNVGDNEATGAAVITSTTTGSVTEGGATQTYNVNLSIAPNAGSNVVVTPTLYLLNSTSTQATFSPTTLTFNSTNFATPQTFTITAANDTVPEATLSATVQNATTVTGTADTRYNGLVANDIALTINDDDTTTGRINIAHTSGSTVLLEDAGFETVQVSLVGPAPSADVTVNLSRQGLTGTDFRYYVNGSAVDTAVLTFTPANYTVAQTVTLIVVPDTGSEAPEVDNMLASTPGTGPTGYTSLSASLPVRILDSDDLGRTLINISHTGTNTRVAEGGATDVIQVALRRAPSANVTLTGSYNTAQLLLTPTNLTFTPSNWNIPQNVTVSAVDDLDLENVHTSGINYIASESGGYLTSDNVALANGVTISDNETVGASMITVNESGGYTFLAETNQTSDTYTLVLGFQPSADVTLTPFASNAIGGTNLVTFSPASVTFNSSNWNTPQTVTVNLATSTVNNGRRAVFVGHTTTTTDASYKEFPAPGVNVIISDANETTAEVYIVPTGAGTSIYEGTPGNTDTVYVFLRKPPTADVVVTPSFAIANQMTFSPATLTFTTANWNRPQILTLTAVNDTTAEPVQTANLTCTPSATGTYAVTNVGTMAVTVNDNDSTGQLVVTPTSTSVVEGGSTTYTVQLSAAPTSQVTVTVVTQKHVVPHSAHTIQYGYYSNGATGSNLQKDNMLFDWTELSSIYTAAYHADRGAAPETTTTAPNGHLAGTKAMLDKLDMLWGGGRYKAKWPDGSSATDNPRLVIIEAIHNCYSLTRLSTDTTNFPNEVRDRCRFAAHLMSISPTATTSH
ncbi:DUF1800 family protein [Brevifollis gellanilyticus]|nr:DUF1800 family protein [Brevifollis gellanilyticus]